MRAKPLRNKVSYTYREYIIIGVGISVILILLVLSIYASLEKASVEESYPQAYRYFFKNNPYPDDPTIESITCFIEGQWYYATGKFVESALGVCYFYAADPIVYCDSKGCREEKK